MTADLLQALGEVAALGGIGGVAAWKAWRADKQTRATGNGWANEMRERLARIETEVRATNGRLDRHLEHHASKETT